MDIQIREAVPGDYQNLCELYLELDNQHRLSHPELFVLPEDYTAARAYLLESMADSNQALFVVEIASNLVGFAECRMQISSDFPILRKREWVQLEGLAVKPGYQKHGIGSLLLKKVREWAQSKKVNRIELKVYTFNSQAETFYLRHGFKELSKAMYLNL
ncbi:acetyltransferase [Desulfosporosinus orientis DSM 765]|uniref:Acetyltransferase n=1 Tax=Desulfosporosinus orientis (strain ATCC 19365 / DSM 765 / NCIMB 8382 / VKM B-1628 / Singapore I) TaxID=768706 RepID=G7W8S7_DESOD|nr:GNAT family N-acetyltransferase [Desulfosporosinus orientis]AET67787.1 acetyltransferase [Desulfosporosinus orientis DSM 765]